MNEEVWLTEGEIEQNFNKSVKDIHEAPENPRFEEEVTYLEDDDYEQGRTSNDVKN